MIQKKFVIKKTDFDGLFVGKLKSFRDFRGSFEKVICGNELKFFLKNKKILQVNLSNNKEKGTARGLHYQIKPFAEKKIIYCLSGEIKDIVVDLRPKSKTFLKSHTINLSEKNKKILFVPEGFAHGYLTLKNNTQILYFHTQKYNKKYERGINFKDKRINLRININKNLISKKDLNL
jgi:dTDP-4-dehydrorhamnose 3,5-epimerase